MDIRFSADSFRGVKLFVATPMYGGMCMSGYLMGMMGLSSACITYGIPMNFHGIGNESLIQKARNACVHAFLESDYTHLLFIDADIGFTAYDVLSLIHVMNTDKKDRYDVLAGPYPKKAVSWKKITKAVQKGFADEDPEVLKNYLGDYTFFAPAGKPFSIKEPAEVLEIGTGFMLISRKTLEAFIQAYPNKTYKGAEGKKRNVFFDCIIHPETKLFITEARFFCQAVRNMNKKVFVAPWLRLSHQGTYPFQERLPPEFIERK